MPRQHRCKRCGHKWQAKKGLRIIARKPQSCPRCKSYNWDRKKEISSVKV